MLSKEECYQALLNLYCYAGYNTNEIELKELDEDKKMLDQLINEYFKLSLTRGELDLLIDLVEPYEEELGNDISFLLYRLRHMRDILPKEKGVVEIVEWEDVD